MELLALISLDSVLTTAPYPTNDKSSPVASARSSVQNLNSRFMFSSLRNLRGQHSAEPGLVNGARSEQQLGNSIDFGRSVGRNCCLKRGSVAASKQGCDRRCNGVHFVFSLFVLSSA